MGSDLDSAAVRHASRRQRAIRRPLIHRMPKAAALARASPIAVALAPTRIVPSLVSLSVAILPMVRLAVAAGAHL